MRRLAFVVLALAAATGVAGCGDGQGTRDVVDVAVADVADAGADVADVADVASGDAADVAVAEEVADDVQNPEDTGSETSEFHWGSGCTGTPTGATWSLIEDSTFKRGPLIQMLDRDKATVMWRTATPSTDEGCVDFIVGDQNRSECGLPDKYGQYEIVLDGLPAATEITYSARVGELKTKDLTFRTMPDTPAPMKFAVFADAHSNIENLRKMTAVALDEGVDFVFGVGDFVREPEVEQYDDTLLGLQNLGSRVNVWTVIGNHDTGLSSTTREHEFFNTFVSPIGIPDEVEVGFGEGYWDHRIGNVWLGGGRIRDFYFSPPEADFGEVAFFKKRFESEEFQTAQWRLFFIHEPPWSQGWGSCDGYNGENCLRVTLMALATANGIQAIFSGHMHGYEYGVLDNVNLLLPGGLGGSLDQFCEPDPGLPQPWTYNYVHNFAIVETGCDQMTVRFMDLDGNELDRVEIPATTPVAQ